MKIRTKEELLDLIDEDLAWRKKELSFLLANVNPLSPSYRTALRAGIVLLYAHWEGFIKNTCEHYLNYVKYLNLKYNELNECFVAISVKGKLHLFEQTNKATIHTQIISFLLNNLGDRANLPVDNIIKTGANLNSEILREILTSIGLDFSDYELKSNLIDSILLKNRNSIAHGQYINLDDVDYKNLHDEILLLMQNLKTKISNSVVMEEYKKN